MTLKTHIFLLHVQGFLKHVAVLTIIMAQKFQGNLESKVLLTFVQITGHSLVSRLKGAGPFAVPVFRWQSSLEHA